MAIERTGNQIDDVLPGVTLDLYRAEPGTLLTVKVEPSLAGRRSSWSDSSPATTSCATSWLASRCGGGKIAEDATLFGDRTLRALAQSLAGLVGGAVPGLAPGRRARSATWASPWRRAAG